MQKEICPPDSQLKLYIDSKLSDTDLALIKDHIKMCGKCRSSFTNLLKAKSASSSAAIQGPYFAKNETTKSDETITEKNSSCPQANAAYPFLDPPKKHGNLGQLGGYELIRVIGEGGMGIVFEAEDEGLGRKVALKVLKPDLTDDTYKKRLAREAKVAGSLEDDHICRVYQVGQDKDISFIAMEFLQGQTLEDKLAKDGWLPIPVAFRIAREIAQGLAVAHDQNLIHRDIKPANIWLEGDPKSSDFKRVKILDFGLARGIDQDNQLTAKGMIVGTPNYMSPEQICGEKLDHKTDLFSLGCLVYRMLSGKIPF
ncbi:MAG: protein kinase domain-containing protein, partial [Gemmataceae bacterium]